MMMTINNGERERVVVTGMGVATSLGLSIAELWTAVIAGRSGVRKIEHYDATTFPVKIGSEIDISQLPFDERGADAGESRMVRYGTYAADQCWRDAGMERTQPGLQRSSVCVGAGVEPSTENQLTQMTFSGIRPNGPPGRLASFLVGSDDLRVSRSTSVVSSILARRFGHGGRARTVHGACTSGTQAIGEAYQLIRHGHSDLVMTGGTDSMLSAFSMAGFFQLGALTTHKDPRTASRPFDRTRNGFVLGEGAAMVVLESLSRATRRGARIYAEVIGYGSSSDAYRFTDACPDAWGAAVCMQRAISSAGILPGDVDYINAHGTATVQNDRIETKAIHRVFGADARRVAVSSTKSQLGHLICAAGAVEFVLTVLALQQGCIPATVNLHASDPECDLDYVPNEARAANPEVAISNSFGFGGQNGTLVMRRFSE